VRFTSSAAAGGGREAEAGFRDALFKGLAPDGGLYVPTVHPDLSSLFSTFNDGVDFQGLAARTTAALLSPELAGDEAREVVSAAFSFQPVLRRLDDRTLLLELFHGPTCAFKDFGAQFLAACMERFAQAEKRRIQVLVATSGDTGSAVAHAFHGRESIDVVILYPSGRVSELQEKQLTTLGGNVHALEVAGSFDDCQRLAKEAFRDGTLTRRLTLTSANSINIGRLIPQSFYYIFGMTRRAELGGPAGICVPSGNFGNLTAALYAWRWGLPVDGFIAATNANDVVPEYLDTGTYRPRPSARTLSNAMDVGSPSNFERLSLLFGGGRDAMRAEIRGCPVTDDDTRRGMREVYERFGVFIDPHTAVGWVAARRCMADGAPGAGAGAGTGAGRGSPHGPRQVMVMSTAHPGKFLDIVRDAVGVEPELPARLAQCLTLPKRSVRISAGFPELSRYLLDSFG
jgi:threonine synthase